MPRVASKASTVAHAVEGLVHAITGLVDRIAGAAQEVRAVGHAAKGLQAAIRGRRRRRKGNPKLKSALRASWASHAPAQRKSSDREDAGGSPRGSRHGARRT
jgi:hypothetical protein